MAPCDEPQFSHIVESDGLVAPDRRVEPSIFHNRIFFPPVRVGDARSQLVAMVDFTVLRSFQPRLTRAPAIDRELPFGKDRQRESSVAREFFDFSSVERDTAKSVNPVLIAGHLEHQFLPRAGVGGPRDRCMIV